MEALSAAAVHVRGGVEDGPAHVRRRGTGGGGLRGNPGQSAFQYWGGGWHVGSLHSCPEEAGACYRLGNRPSNRLAPLVLRGRSSVHLPPPTGQPGLCRLRIHGVAPRVWPLTTPEREGSLGELEGFGPVWLMEVGWA